MWVTHPNILIKIILDFALENVKLSHLDSSKSGRKIDDEIANTPTKVKKTKTNVARIC